MFHLNSKQFFEAHRISMISPISQMRKEGSEWLKGLSRATWLVGVSHQILIPLLSPSTMVLPIITVISVNRIFTPIFQPKSTETLRNFFPPHDNALIQ